mmetsp:Transcript_12926/g.23937  ORF Transcript_12926/g.23937 Transcript_12926/m.23937 type:complete len:238 (-) Transcript_12926:464-1177(-)
MQWTPPPPPPPPPAMPAVAAVAADTFAAKALPFWLVRERLASSRWSCTEVAVAVAVAVALSQRARATASFSTQRTATWLRPGMNQYSRLQRSEPKHVRRMGVCPCASAMAPTHFWCFASASPTLNSSSSAVTPKMPTTPTPPVSNKAAEEADDPAPPPPCLALLPLPPFVRSPSSSAISVAPSPSPSSPPPPPTALPSFFFFLAAAFATFSSSLAFSLFAWRAVTRCRTFKLRRSSK